MTQVTASIYPFFEPINAVFCFVLKSPFWFHKASVPEEGILESAAATTAWRPSIVHQCVEYGLFVNIPLSEHGLRGIMIAVV